MIVVWMSFNGSRRQSREMVTLATFSLMSFSPNFIESNCFTYSAMSVDCLLSSGANDWWGVVGWGCEDAKWQGICDKENVPPPPKTRAGVLSSGRSPTLSENYVYMVVPPSPTPSAVNFSHTPLSPLVRDFLDVCLDFLAPSKLFLFFIFLFYFQNACK